MDFPVKGLLDHETFVPPHWVSIKGTNKIGFIVKKEENDNYLIMVIYGKAHDENGVYSLLEGFASCKKEELDILTKEQMDMVQLLYGEK